MSRANMNGLIEVKRDLTKEISNILMEFHSTVFKILKICRKLEPNNVDLEWLHNKLSLARDIDPLLIINRAKDKMWFYRNQIIENDMDFFLNNKFSEFVKNDENKTFMYTLIGLIKTKISQMSDPEIEHLWKLSKIMLKCVIHYKKAINDYVEE
jgi:hypothetical protein